MLAPGQAHSFHKHTSQEEVMYVVAGQVEQWVDRETRHSFRRAWSTRPSTPARRQLTFLSSSVHVGDGFEVIDVSNEAPWNGLRD
jgi:hypothetical protein